MMTRRVSAVILDVDGTLYRQRPVRLRMLLRLAARTIIRPREMTTVLRVLAAYRHAQEQMRDRWVDCLSIAEEQIRAACQRTKVSEATVACHVAKWMEEAPLDLLRPAMRKGLLEFLRDARQKGLRLAVWSDYPAVRKLEAMGLQSFFDVVVTAQDARVQRFKPDPRGIEEVLSRLGVSKDEVVYVGDRPEVDGVAAARAGIRCYIVGERRQHNGADAPVAPFEVVKDFTDIMHRITAGAASSVL